MTSLSNRSSGQIAATYAAVTLGSGAGPLANAGAAAKKNPAHGEILLKKIVGDDNDLERSGCTPALLCHRGERGKGENTILGTQKLRQPSKDRGELLTI